MKNLLYSSILAVGVSCGGSEEVSDYPREVKALSSFSLDEARSYTRNQGNPQTKLLTPRLSFEIEGCIGDFKRMSEINGLQTLHLKGQYIDICLNKYH
jgi:hypothetical protein